MPAAGEAVTENDAKAAGLVRQMERPGKFFAPMIFKVYELFHE